MILQVSYVLTPSQIPKPWPSCFDYNGKSLIHCRREVPSAATSTYNKKNVLLLYGAPLNVPRRMCTELKGSINHKF